MSSYLQACCSYFSPDPALPPLGERFSTSFKGYRDWTFKLFTPPESTAPPKKLNIVPLSIPKKKDFETHATAACLQDIKQLLIKRRSLLDQLQICYDKEFRNRDLPQADRDAYKPEIAAVLKQVLELETLTNFCWERYSRIEGADDSNLFNALFAQEKALIEQTRTLFTDLRNYNLPFSLPVSKDEEPVKSVDQQIFEFAQKYPLTLAGGAVSTLLCLIPACPQPSWLSFPLWRAVPTLVGCAASRWGNVTYFKDLKTLSSDVAKTTLTEAALPLALVAGATAYCYGGGNFWAPLMIGAAASAQAFTIYKKYSAKAGPGASDSSPSAKDRLLTGVGNLALAWAKHGLVTGAIAGPTVVLFNHYVYETNPTASILIGASVYATHVLASVVLYNKK